LFNFEFILLIGRWMAITMNGGFNIRTVWVNEKMCSLMAKIKLVTNLGNSCPCLEFFKKSLKIPKGQYCVLRGSIKE